MAELLLKWQQFSPRHSQSRANALTRGSRRSFAHYLALCSSGMGRADPYASINQPTHPLMAELLRKILNKVVRKTLKDIDLLAFFVYYKDN